jgi:hypothetical protein
MRLRLVRLLLRVYPARWRDRYGEEFAALLEDTPATPSVIADAVGAAATLHVRAATQSLITSGGPAVTIDFGGWHSRTFAVLAILVALPTTVVLALSGLAYNLNLPGLAQAMDPFVRSLSVSKLLGLGLMSAPVLAFLIAVLPVLRFSIHRENGELMISFGIRGRALTLVAIALSLLLIAFFAMHSAAEFLFGT